MPLSKFLAAAFGDEIVILDAERGSLLKLDAWAAQVWSGCKGSSSEIIASPSTEPPERVHETLQALAEAGLIRHAGNEWIRSPVEWV